MVVYPGAAGACGTPRRLLREPAHLRAGQAAGRRPRRRAARRLLRARLGARRPRRGRRHRLLPRPGATFVERPDRGTATRQSTRARWSTCWPRTASSRQAFQVDHRRLHHPGRRPAGLPDNLASRRRAVRSAVRPVQGGGIFANAYARYLQITNNIIQSNGGAYAGAIRLGTPNLPGALERQPERLRRASPTTASWPTAARTWPAPSASSPAPTTTRSPTTTSAATSRPSTAAASATTASAPTARSTTTASTSTAPTTKAAGS